VIFRTLPKLCAAVALVPAFSAIAATNAVPVEAGLRDIRGPVDIATVMAWLVRALLVAVPLALLAVAWWWRRRRKRPAEQVVRETAAARARARLSEAWSLLDHPERFCTLLSEIVRVYLEERFGLRAPDRTTEEFLSGLQDSVALGQIHKRLLEDFLTQCDLVKFAKGDPERDELERLHQLAARLVDDTGVELPPLHEAVGAKGGGR
jgi:hypothetical protein